MLFCAIRSYQPNYESDLKETTGMQLHCFNVYACYNITIIPFAASDSDEHVLDEKMWEDYNDYLRDLIL